MTVVGEMAPGSLAHVPRRCSPGRPKTSAPRAASCGPGWRPAAARSSSGRSTTATSCASARARWPASGTGSSPTTSKASSRTSTTRRWRRCSTSPGTRAGSRSSPSGWSRRPRRAASAWQEGCRPARPAGAGRLRRPHAARGSWIACSTRLPASIPRLTPDMVITLITTGVPMTTAATGIDLAGEMRERLTDQNVAEFIAQSVSRDQGATERLGAGVSGTRAGRRQARRAARTGRAGGANAADRAASRSFPTCGRAPRTC